MVGPTASEAKVSADTSHSVDAVETKTSVCSEGEREGLIVTYQHLCQHIGTIVARERQVLILPACQK